MNGDFLSFQKVRLLLGTFNFDGYTEDFFVFLKKNNKDITKLINGLTENKNDFEKNKIKKLLMFITPFLYNKTKLDINETFFNFYINLKDKSSDYKEIPVNTPVLTKNENYEKFLNILSTRFGSRIDGLLSEARDEKYIEGLGNIRGNNTDRFITLYYNKKSFKDTDGRFNAARLVFNYDGGYSDTAKRKLIRNEWKRKVFAPVYISKWDTGYRQLINSFFKWSVFNETLSSALIETYYSYFPYYFSDFESFENEGDLDKITFNVKKQIKTDSDKIKSLLKTVLIEKSGIYLNAKEKDRVNKLKSVGKASANAFFYKNGKYYKNKKKKEDKETQIVENEILSGFSTSAYYQKFKLLQSLVLLNAYIRNIIKGNFKGNKKILDEQIKKRPAVFYGIEKNTGAIAGFYAFIRKENVLEKTLGSYTFDDFYEDLSDFITKVKNDNEAVCKKDEWESYKFGGNSLEDMSAFISLLIKEIKETDLSGIKEIDLNVFKKYITESLKETKGGYVIENGEDFILYKEDETNDSILHFEKNDDYFDFSVGYELKEITGEGEKGTCVYETKHQREKYPFVCLNVYPATGKYYEKFNPYVIWNFFIQEETDEMFQEISNLIKKGNYGINDAAKRFFLRDSDEHKKMFYNLVAFLDFFFFNLLFSEKIKEKGINKLAILTLYPKEENDILYPLVKESVLFLENECGINIKESGIVMQTYNGNSDFKIRKTIQKIIADKKDFKEDKKPFDIHFVLVYPSEYNKIKEHTQTYVNNYKDYLFIDIKISNKAEPAKIYNKVSSETQNISKFFNEKMGISSNDIVILKFFDEAFKDTEEGKKLYAEIAENFNIADVTNEFIYFNSEINGNDPKAKGAGSIVIKDNSDYIICRTAEIPRLLGSKTQNDEYVHYGLKLRIKHKKNLFNDYDVINRLFTRIKVSSYEEKVKTKLFEYYKHSSFSIKNDFYIKLNENDYIKYPLFLLGTLTSIK